MSDSVITNITYMTFFRYGCAFLVVVTMMQSIHRHILRVLPSRSVSIDFVDDCR